MDCETRLSKFSSIFFSLLFLAVSIVEIIGIFKDLYKSTNGYAIPIATSIFFTMIVLLIIFHRETE